MVVKMDSTPKADDNQPQSKLFSSYSRLRDTHKCLPNSVCYGFFFVNKTFYIANKFVW